MKENENFRRVIVDYNKLNDDVLNLVVTSYPDGYNTSNIVSFKNQYNEMIECVEVHTDHTKYLVKVSKKLIAAMEDYEADENYGLHIDTAEIYA